MFELLEKVFGSRDVYSVLNNISPEAAAHPKKLRYAYLRAAFLYHPDKATSEEERKLSTQKFQLLGKIYEVLQDEDKRKAFQETGQWPDEDSLDMDLNVFSRLDENTFLQKYKELQESYQGSEEEMNDVKALYEKHQGNLFEVMDNLLFTELLDGGLDRIESLVSQLVKKGELEEIPLPKNYEAQKKRRIAKAKKEAAEAEELRKMLVKGKKVKNDMDLVTTIMSRREDAGKSFLDALEEKYAGTTKEPRSKKPRKN